MANPGVAVPGSVVAIGSQVSPAGPQGIQGPSTISANANNKATLGTDSLVLVQGTAAGVAATTHAQTVSGDDPQLTNARTPTAHETSHVTGSDQIPLASSSTKGLLTQTSGNTTDFIDGTNNSQPLQPVIWSTRLRSINVLGNSTFECDQRTCFTGVTNSGWLLDRWTLNRSGTMTGTGVGTFGLVPIPGTSSFNISQYFLRITLTGQEVSLAAGDNFQFQQGVESQYLREICSDVTSISLLVRSSVANLKFGVALRDGAATHSLIKLATLGAANTWALISLPNIASFVSSGAGLALNPGNLGYILNITLACGTTYTAPANDTWQTGNFIGAVGQSNFAAQPVNSTFDIAFVQHEPGAVCTTPMDLPFSGPNGNLEACKRYYQKSWNYGTKAGTVGNSQTAIFNFPLAVAGPTTLAVYGNAVFAPRMAKTPTVTGYNNTTGAAGGAQFTSAGFSGAVSIAGYSVGENGIFQITIPSASSTSAYMATFDWTADTGW